MHRKNLRHIKVFVLIALLASDMSFAACDLLTPDTNPNDKSLVQVFEVSDRVETAWLIRWAWDPTKYGFYIAGAWFRKTPGGQPVRILGDLRLTYLLTTYHDDDHLVDIFRWGFEPIVAQPEWTGPCGEIAGSGVYVKEIRDYGPIYMSHEPYGQLAAFRRGRSLVLWSAYDVGNYEFIVEYGFRDDGSITARLGSTGYNNKDKRLIAHNHTAMWRIDVELDGPANDAVLVTKHKEVEAGSGFATDSAIALDEEKGGEWDPKAFTTLEIEDLESKNRNGSQISYELLPSYGGKARHFGTGSSFIKKDYWVTVDHEGEFDGNNIDTHTNKERLSGEDVVLWAVTSVHHRPRDEDFGFPDRAVGAGAEITNERQGPWAVGPGENIFGRGLALVMWSGFTLRPRDLFDGTPLIEPIVYRLDPDTPRDPNNPPIH